MGSLEKAKDFTGNYYYYVVLAGLQMVLICREFASRKTAAIGCNPRRCVYREATESVGHPLSAK